MTDIEVFCDSVLVLNQGEPVYKGDVKGGISIFEHLRFPKSETKEEKKEHVLNPQYVSRESVKRIDCFWCDRYGTPIDTITAGKDLYFLASFELSFRPKNLILGVPVWSENGIYVTGFSSLISSSDMHVDDGPEYKLRLVIPSCELNPGIYYSNFAIHDGPECLYRVSNSNLEVAHNNNRYWGVVTIPHRREKK
jgi:hypothetical protein